MLRPQVMFGVYCSEPTFLSLAVHRPKNVSGFCESRLKIGAEPGTSIPPDDRQMAVKRVVSVSAHQWDL